MRLYLPLYLSNDYSIAGTGAARELLPSLVLLPPLPSDIITINCLLFFSYCFELDSSSCSIDALRILFVDANVVFGR